MKTIIVKASNARPSAHYSVEERMRNGAVDVDIALEIEHAYGKRELPCSDGEVTLFRDDANGGQPRQREGRKQRALLCRLHRG